jgi:site-specific DNA-methyltransferase (adenine-specific)
VSSVLHLGSCLDPITGLATLGDLSVDVTATDPPYEAEAHNKGKRQNPGNGKGKEERGKMHKRVVDEEFNFPPITEVERTEVGAHIARVTKKIALVFCQVEAAMLWRKALERDGLIYRRTIPWVKPDAMPSLHGRWPGQSFESIVLLSREGIECPVGGKSRYYEATRERGATRAHETAKPLKLMKQIVLDFTLPGEVVLDSYMGSGTTGVAAKHLGRSFIGWELAACALCAITAEWDCSWLSKDAEKHAYLCDEHRVTFAAKPGFKSHRDNMFHVATRRINGDEAKPRPEQPSLFDAIGGL